MREIKFRAKMGTVKGDKWIYGYLYKVKSLLDEKYQYYIKNEHLQDFAIDEKTIGQFTGLYDKNGTPIYESDIVKNHCGYKAIVKYGKYIYGGITHTGFYIQDKEFNDIFNLMDCNIEVIGNIHDMEENNGK